MGFQSGVNQTIGTIGAMASVKKVVEGQQEGLAKQEEGIAKQEESNKLAKEIKEQQDAQNTLLAMDEAKDINQEFLQNSEAIKSGEKELGKLGVDYINKIEKKNKTKSKIWKDRYQKAMDEMNNRIESIGNTTMQLKLRQKALKDRAEIMKKNTGGKIDDYLFLGTPEEWRKRYGEE